MIIIIIILKNTQIFHFQTIFLLQEKLFNTKVQMFPSTDRSTSSLFENNYPSLLRVLT